MAANGPTENSSLLVDIFRRGIVKKFGPSMWQPQADNLHEKNMPSRMQGVMGLGEKIPRLPDYVFYLY